MNGRSTGNPALDAFLAATVPQIALRKRPAFKGKSADERLDLARLHLEACSKFVDHKARIELERPIACGDRCAACCIYSDQVAVLPLELRRILDLVEREGRLEEVERRAKARQARGKGACPLLSRNGRCTVYAERPISCMRYHSVDREACRRCAHDGGRTSVPWIPALVATGLALGALAQWDPGTHLVDLFHALPRAVAARLKQSRKRRRRAGKPT
jgi:Fe-S-cluster containining protein